MTTLAEAVLASTASTASTDAHVAVHAWVAR